MGKLGNFDEVDSFETQPKNKVETVHSATDNDRKKLNHINIPKISESNPSELKEGLDSNKAKDYVEKGRLNNRDASRQKPEKQGDLVHTGTAFENPQYGAGGGKQYFIPDAKQMMDKNDGRLNKTGETKLQYTDAKEKSIAPLDTRPLSKSENAEWKQLDKNTSDKPSVPANIDRTVPKIDTRPLSESENAEWKQLDENTQDERGLPKVMNEGEQKAEDRTHPWSDQEDTYGSFSPDAWSNPRKLKDGEKLYQLRPENAERTSPYFTDAETVNKCRKENGDVDVGKLLQSLQINPGDNENWTLREYEYRKNK